MVPVAIMNPVGGFDSSNFFDALLNRPEMDEVLDCPLLRLGPSSVLERRGSLGEGGRDTEGKGSGPSFCVDVPVAGGVEEEAMMFGD